MQSLIIFIPTHYRRDPIFTIPSVPLLYLTRQSGQNHLAVRLGTSDSPMQSRWNHSLSHCYCQYRRNAKVDKGREHTSGFSQQIIVPKLTSPHIQYRGSLESICSRTPSSSRRRPSRCSGSRVPARFLVNFALRRP